MNKEIINSLKSITKMPDSKKKWLIQRTLKLIDKWQLVNFKQIEKMALIKHALEIEIKKY